MLIDEAIREWVVIDTETTGLIQGDKPVDIVSLSIVSLDGETLYHECFMPLIPIEDGASAVNGITIETLHQRGAKKIEDEYDKISKLMRYKNVIAYNSFFDENVIAKALALHNLLPIQCTWHCAQKAYKKYNPNKEQWGKKGVAWKLAEALREEKLEFEGEAHNSLSDALMTAKLVNKTRIIIDNPTYIW